MHTATFAQVQPILGTRDLAKAISFYVDRLGFTLAFGDSSVPVNYVGLRRDKVELHMQFQYEHEMGTIRLRLVVDDPDALYEYGVAREHVEEPNRKHLLEAAGFFKRALGVRPDHERAENEKPMGIDPNQLNQGDGSVEMPRWLLLRGCRLPLPFTDKNEEKA